MCDCEATVISSPAGWVCARTELLGSPRPTTFSPRTRSSYCPKGVNPLIVILSISALSVVMSLNADSSVSRYSTT